MVVHLNSCCCGCTLKQGSIIIGVLNAFGSLVFIVLLSYLSTRTDELPDEIKEYEHIIKTGLIVAACFSVVDTIIGILLVVGSVSRIPALVKTWVVYHSVGLVLVVIGDIVLFFAAGAFHIGGFVGFAITVALQVYYILVVNSYHTELKKGPPEVFHPHANYQPAQVNPV